MIKQAAEHDIARLHHLHAEADRVNREFDKALQQIWGRWIAPILPAFNALLAATEPAPDGSAPDGAPHDTGEAGDDATRGDSPCELTVHDVRHLVGILDQIACSERDHARAELAALKQRVREALPPEDPQGITAWIDVRSDPAGIVDLVRLIRREVLAALDGEEESRG